MMLMKRRMADRIIVVKDGQLVAETAGARGESPEVAQTAARVHFEGHFSRAGDRMNSCRQQRMLRRQSFT